MKVGDTIAVPGYGEYKLSLGDNACAGCEAEYVDNTPTFK